MFNLCLFLEKVVAWLNLIAPNACKVYLKKSCGVCPLLHKILYYNLWISFIFWITTPERYKCVWMLCILLIEIANRRTYIQYFWVHSLRSYLYVWLNLALRATYVLSDSVDAVQMCLFVCRWAHIQKLPDQTLLKQDQSYFDSMLIHCWLQLPTNLELWTWPPG